MLPVVCLVIALCLSGCMIGDGPLVPQADLQPALAPLPAPPVVAPLPIPAPTKEELAALCVDMPRPTPLLASVAKPVKSVGLRKSAPVLPPTRVVQDAQRDARIEPDARGYFGGSGEQAYVYQAGKIYTIYLAANTATPIALPPGEKQISGLVLNEKMFTVEPGRAGKDANAYDFFSVYPEVETGEFTTHVVTESGRRYLLHLIIGKVGMAAVSFELPQGR